MDYKQLVNYVESKKQELKESGMSRYISVRILSTEPPVAMIIFFLGARNSSEELQEYLREISDDMSAYIIKLGFKCIKRDSPVSGD